MKMNLDAELATLYEELRHTNLQPYITEKQVRALAILMGKCIKAKGKLKKTIRIYSLNQIAGKALQEVAYVEKITSTKNLTGTMASILLDLFKEDKEDDWNPSGYAKRLFEALESKFEKDIGAGEIRDRKVGVVS